VPPPHTVATAFGHTFLWATAIAFLAIIPAALLLRAEQAHTPVAAPPAPAALRA
jgi:hypothetical protein